MAKKETGSITKTIKEPNTLLWTSNLAKFDINSLTIETIIGLDNHHISGMFHEFNPKQDTISNGNTWRRKYVMN